MFRSALHRKVFMQQLCDGWGENHCDLSWRGDFSTATRFTVRPDQDDIEHAKRVRSYLESLPKAEGT